MIIQLFQFHFITSFSIYQESPALNLEQLDFNYHNVKQKETAGQKDINKTVSKTKIKHKYNTET